MNKDTQEAKDKETVANDDSLLVEDQPTDEAMGQTPEAYNPIADKTDEEVLASASQSVSDQEDPAPEKKPKPKKSKKPLLVVLIVLVLAAAGAAGWWYYNNQQSSESAQNTEQTPETTQEAALTYEPNTVVYTFSESTDVPYNVYSRPASGGERSEALKLDKNENAGSTDIHGNTVVFSTADSIFVSTDGGTSYKEIMQLSAGEQVTSVKLSSDGQKIAYGLLPDVAGKNSVRSIDLNGENVADLFISESAGVFILGFDAEKIIYSTGCYNCDGNKPDPQLRNLSNNEVTDLLPDVADNLMWQAAVSDDLTKLVYAYGSDVPLNLGPPQAPHTIAVLDIASQESTELATIGEAGETNPNGTDKSRNTIVGFLAGTSTPYYTDDTQLYSAENDTPSLLYESEDPIIYVEFASKINVIAGTGTYQEYVLANFSVESQEAATIFNGDTNTRIIGVTTN